MQNNWVRFVKGCISVKLGGDYLERFFNMCRTHDIYLWGIRRENDICVCNMYASDFFKLPPLLNKTGTRAKVIRKSGVPFYIPFMKKRIIFFAGVILCLIMLNLVTNYVWAIEYIGNLQVSDNELTDFLNGQDIHYGIKKSEINCEEKEKRLREAFPNVTWTSIYFEGTKLCVEVKENEKTEPKKTQTRGTDIISEDEGVIISIVTRNGVPKVKAGDTVVKGQVLVEGSVPVYNEEQVITDYQIYDADADIWIKAPIIYKDEVSKSYPVLFYTGNDADVGFFEAFGFHIDGLLIYDLFHKSKTDLYETLTQKHQLVLLDNIYLPIYYGRINRKEYSLKYLAHTTDEMKEILSDNFEKFISELEEKGVQIVEKNVKIVKNRNSMKMQGDITAIKPTGSAVDIQITDEAQQIQEAASQ